MNERQKRRRANARLIAQADGRAWQTGAEAQATKDRERSRERVKQHVNANRRRHNLSPVTNAHIELTGEWQERARVAERLRFAASNARSADERERGLRAEQHAARRSAVFQSVRTVDTPAPMIGAFRKQSI